MDVSRLDLPSSLLVLHLFLPSFPRQSIIGRPRLLNTSNGSYNSEALNFGTFFGVLASFFSFLNCSAVPSSGNAGVSRSLSISIVCNVDCTETRYFTRSGIVQSPVLIILRSSVRKGESQGSG